MRQLLIGKITPTMAVFAALVLAGAVVTSVVLEEGGSPASGLAAGEASFGNSDVISCISRTWCVDLGFAVNGLTENVFWSWDGHRWSQMRNAASYADDTSSTVNGIACASARQCVAVGTHVYNCGSDCTPREVPLTVEWNGASWAESPLVAGPDNTSAELDSVSCPRLDDCIAVGATTEGALTEQWDGEHWSVTPNPLAEIHPYEPAGDDLDGDALQSVSCPTTRFCMAAGGFGDLYEQSVLSNLIAAKAFAGATAATVDLSAVTEVEKWNGARWSATLVPFPYQSPQDASERGFNTVACAGPTMCAAVGTYYPGTLPNEGSAVGAAIDQWNGHSWTSSKWPPFGLPADEPLLSCTRAWCMAAYEPASTVPSGDDFAVVNIAIWNGGRWSPGRDVRVATSFVPERQMWEPPFAFAFACGSADFCVASGDASQGMCGHGESYATYWTGASWTVDVVGRRTPPSGCQ